jgi:glycosyltransferase involved in cell wall biosynthesis
MSDPTRLALVITELEPGGAERCLVNLATRLNRREYAPVVYSLAPRPLEGRDQLVRQLALSGVPVHFLGLTHWTHYVRGVRRLTALLKEQAAEVMQTFLFHANVVGARAASKAGIAQIYTGIRVADPRWRRTMVERWLTAAAHQHVCVSQSVADFCRRRGFAAEKLVVIPNGIEVERWKSSVPADLTQFGLPAGCRTIVYVGRLDRQKGLPDLLAAMSELLEFNADCHLLIVGDGRQRGNLEQVAGERGIRSRVHFAGWQAEVPGILKASDLLVLSSHWEGMPNAVLEAMACGKPVVATRAQGVVELLGDLAGEQTVPVGERKLLAEKIQAVLGNPSRAQELGNENQRRVDAEFGLERMIERYSRLYRDADRC